MTDTTDGNGKITWRDIYTELNKHADARIDMERRLSEKIDSIRDCIPSVEVVKRAADRAEDAHKRINDLQKQDKSWNMLNSIGVVIASILATVFGIGNK